MPASDQQENTEYIDDNTIDNNTLLYRRIMNQAEPPVMQIIWDDNKNCWRPSSVSFSDHPNGSPMSIALGDTLEHKGLEPESILDGHDGFSLASFPASVARAKGQGIMRKPLEGDPAHGEVFGKKTKGVKRFLADNSEWCIEPNLPNPND